MNLFYANEMWVQLKVPLKNENENERKTILKVKHYLKAKKLLEGKNKLKKYKNNKPLMKKEMLTCASNTWKYSRGLL